MGVDDSHSIELDNHIEANNDTVPEDSMLVRNNMNMALDACLHKYLITILLVWSNRLLEGLLLAILQRNSFHIPLINYNSLDIKKFLIFHLNIIDLIILKKIYYKKHKLKIKLFM